ncbi:GNAT family N-acetyltransferase [Vibrio salinus]|uniref:GNAT family N-acetyltransferase n=1 Tax=Vibrio salinus TaxID=2899784 RepID=UPI001E3BE0D5|nr:GNAT family N-acetyltransferase [Vibrio salinus]MCE0495321.1 GNAT family N-acetyltransferase [Vibrio salinus]
MVEHIITYYLEMLSPQVFKPKPESNGLVVRECEIDSWEVNRFLYEFVGKEWNWTDKLTWSDCQWRDYVSQPNLKTWIGYYQGSIAGYFELSSGTDGNVEIMYFGLAGAFIGKGFGGYFLSKAIECAWSLENTRRVWVHTCTLDHPVALANYQARGFSIYKEEIETVVT